MGERKKHQPPMSIDEQVENLKSIGLFVKKLEQLFEKYENVDVKTMGFPEKWKELL